MPILTRKKVDSAVEKKIATAAIISKKFLQEIKPIYDSVYIKNSFVKVILHWCTQYYTEYDKAPGIHIKDIWELERSDLSKEESDIIEAFLTNLSEQYVEDQGINEDYVLDSAFEYFKKRELEITAGNITKLLENGKVDEAEDQLTKYKKVAKLTSGWSNPFDIKSIHGVFEESPEGLFKLPGQLGSFLGPFEREWLVGILGSFKKGKTWWIMELGIMALFHKLRVVFISLEMKKVTMDKRLYKRITGGGDSDDPEFIYPVFDCIHNQTGECTNPKRTNHIRLINEEGIRSEFTKDLKYKPCSICKGTNEYQMETWFEYLKRPKFTLKNVVKSIRSFQKMYGSNIRTISYPKFSANISDIKRDLDILEQTEDFIPDVILIDYAGILKPEDSKAQKREQIDDTWKTLGQLAAERRCLVVTGWQGNRGAIYKKQMDQESISEWIGILGHVDIFMSINQTKEEKRNKQVRIGLLGHRHMDFNEDETCVVLQQLDLGQVELDSERIFDID